MAVPRRNCRSATALATVVLALIGHVLLLATHSHACGSSCPKPTPTPTPTPTAAPVPRSPTATPTKAQGGGEARCPVNALKLGACASVLGGLVSLELGHQQRPASASSSTQPCCQLLGGLADLDAAVCLCAALRANVLGVVQLSTHVDLSVLVNYCGKKLPQGFQCPRAN